VTSLSGSDRDMIRRARRLYEAGSTDSLRAIVGRGDGASDELVRTEALGIARFLLGELADRLERTGGSEDQAAEDTRRLAAIREVLKHFDWEYHDRQLALEAIERIAEGGHA
jgi:hypothetical protein